MVTLVWGGGEGVLGEAPPPWFLIILKKPWGGGGGEDGELCSHGDVCHATSDIRHSVRGFWDTCVSACGSGMSAHDSCPHGHAPRPRLRAHCGAWMQPRQADNGQAAQAGLSCMPKKKPLSAFSGGYNCAPQAHRRARRTCHRPEQFSQTAEIVKLVKRRKKHHSIAIGSTCL